MEMLPVANFFTLILQWTQNSNDTQHVKRLIYAQLRSSIEWEDLDPKEATGRVL